MRTSYNTNQKKLIISYLTKKQYKYVSANDILLYLAKKDERVGLTTIYRILSKLNDEGRLRVETVGNTKKYQYILDDCEGHFHLKCEKCGRLEHVDCKEMAELKNHIFKEHRFYINSKSVILGVCQKCKKITGGRVKSEH